MKKLNFTQKQYDESFQKAKEEIKEFKRVQEKKIIFFSIIFASICATAFILFLGDDLTSYADIGPIQTVLVIIGIMIFFRYILYSVTIFISTRLFSLERKK